MPKCPVCRDTGFSQANRYAPKETCLCQFTAPAPQPVEDAVRLAWISRATEGMEGPEDFAIVEQLADDSRAADGRPFIMDMHARQAVTSAKFAIRSMMNGRAAAADAIYLPGAQVTGPIRAMADELETLAQILKDLCQTIQSRRQEAIDDRMMERINDDHGDIPNLRR